MADVQELLKLFQEQLATQQAERKELQKQRDEMRKEREESLALQQKEREDNLAAQQTEREANQNLILQLFDKLASQDSRETTPRIDVVTIPPFQPFKPKEELWNDYKRRFQTFVHAQTVPQNRITQIFLINQSPILYKQIETWHSQQGTQTLLDDLTFDEVSSFLNQQYNPQYLLLHQRYLFWSDMRRLPGEKIKDLADRTRTAAMTCDFSSIQNPLEEALRTRFICSIDNEPVVNTLFRYSEKELTFEKAVEIASQMEETALASRETVQDKNHRYAETVNKLQNTNKKPTKDYTCIRCGKPGHKANECHHRKSTCRYCDKVGHLEVVCIKKKRAAQAKNFADTKKPFNRTRRGRPVTVRKIVGQNPVPSDSKDLFKWTASQF